MKYLFGTIFPAVAAGVMICALSASASAHPKINGTWELQPSKSNFAGEPTVETGTVTINDREHHIFISRTFNYDNAAGGFDYSFTTDGQENSTIKKGKNFRSKAKWEGDTLKVTTTQDGMTTIEHYNLTPDGTLVLMVDRPNHHSETLFFIRK